MQEEYCDIWDKHAEKKWICITTNYGWRADGWAVMGAGCAAQCADRYSVIAYDYGQFCKSFHKKHLETVFIPVRVYEQQRIICFATKSLNIEKPWTSWQADSSIDQIILSCKSLVNYITDNRIVTNVYLPRPGCNNGKLSWKFVKKHIEHLLPENVVVVNK